MRNRDRKPENKIRFTTDMIPWEHILYRNLFDPDDFPEVQRRVSSWPKTPPDKRRISMFILNQEKEGYIYDPWLYDKLVQTFSDAIHGIDWKNYVPIFEYNSCPEGYEYPIHVDAPEKILSLVIYISNKGDGTVLYDENKNRISQLEWIPNEGFMFLRDDVSWHSYHSSVNHRDTINCILVKKDKKLLRNLRYNVDV